ncbi:MAG TPA: ATP-binding protein [Thermoanaerobaculia bacterium]|nr:ATP-binding protein [Thermoanaerobaculia bacterium]
MTAELIDHEHFPTLGEVASRPAPIHPQTLVKLVSDEFFRNATLDAVAVVERDLPIGLVTRTKFLATVFRQFGWELYGRKPITAIPLDDPLIMPATVRLDVALATALERPQANVYDEIVVVDDDGRYSGLLSVKQMVLQQSHSLGNILVQKELAHERARELEEVTRIKSQFLANVTHELRSPVNAIIELAELMRMAAENGYVGQVRDRLSLLMQSATNLRSVITNMLDLSKIEAGRMRVIVEEFDLVPVLHEIADTTRVLLGGRPVEVIVSTERPCVTMTSDPVKLRQMLLNLASNAAKFTEEGRIVLQQTSSDAMMALTVSDTGTGIRAEDLDKLFIAFNQLEDAHTKRHAGTGLGLTITRELAGLLGGRVAVESAYGVGTVFTVHIPKHIEGDDFP